MKKIEQGQWLLLIHNIPPKPDYLRVKIWRNLQRLGAIPIKNSIYALPNNEHTTESFQWLMREIIKNKGEASICEAKFIDGLTHQQIEGLFNSARTKEYNDLIDVSENILKKLKHNTVGSRKSKAIKSVDHDSLLHKDIKNELSRLKNRLSEIIAIDFFEAPGREKVENRLNDIESFFQMNSDSSKTTPKMTISLAELKGKVWVTRKGVHVDRIASAWFIRKFIDTKAKMKFVDSKNYMAKSQELRFDMFEGEFTHEGDQCTFEVLTRRAGVKEPALSHLCEIIHEMDLQDDKFDRPEIIGIEKIFNGICMSCKDDEERLKQGSALLDNLYAYFSKTQKKNKK